MKDKLHEMLERHEGRRTHLYKDSEGILTIGVGWNIQEHGLPDHIIDSLLDYSIAMAEKDALTFKWFPELDDVRKAVIVDMLFNLGLKRFLGFKDMIHALEIHDYDVAAHEMYSSKWAKQVGDRALELATMMTEGKFLK